MQRTFFSRTFTAKRAYEHNLINNYAHSRDPGIFRYICRLTNSRSLLAALHTDSSVITNDIDKAYAFNQYFYSVLKLSSTCNCTCSIDTSIEEVFNALINLQPNKASGLDNI